jgi:hypothetical protein
VKIADEFNCPAGDLAGWKALQQKVLNGEDLNPHLSKRHASLFNNDGLLAEWGVHHFHLGTGPDRNDPSFVRRTGPLVFALVDDEVFCAINVFAHGDSFEDVAIVECLHRNWPEMIRRYRGKGVTGATLDKTQRRAIRGKNGNVLVAVKDGTVYMPIGGGVAASGVKMESVICADKWHIEIQSLEGRFENQLGELMPILEQCGYGGEDEVEAELKITETGYQVLFPKYGILANLSIHPTDGLALVFPFC